MKKTSVQLAVKQVVSEASLAKGEAPSDQVPLMGIPVIDKLTFILPVLVGPMYSDERIPEKMMRRIEKSLEKKKCIRWHAGESRYRMQLRVPLPSGAKAQVQIGAKKPMEQKGGFRIELNPAKLAEGDIEYLYKLIGRWLKGYGELEDLLRRARISRMDVAVDVVHCAIVDLLIGYKGVHQFTVFGNTMKGGRFQTINFGSMGSDYIAAVYNKRDEVVRRIVADAEKSGSDESLKAARIKQLKVAAGAPPTMRVEIRGMKIGCAANQLLTVGARRFERFVFVELQAIEGLTEFERRNFVALVRDSSLREAVALHKGQPTYKHVKKALTQTATWWEPEGLWARGINTLRKSGIFPKDAFARGG